MAGEFACDEKVTFGMNEEEKKKYCGLIFEMAQKKNKRLYITNFGNKHRVEERIKRMINGKDKKKGWQIFSGVLLSVLIISISSFTTWAYEPPAVIGLSYLEKEVEHGHGDIDRYFVEDGYESELHFGDVDIFEMSFADSDAYFVDEQGNRYDIAENTAKVSCNHTFTGGRYNEHVKNGVGCTVTIYNSEKCTKCGYVEILDVYSEISYPKCPH